MSAAGQTKAAPRDGSRVAARGEFLSRFPHHRNPLCLAGVSLVRAPAKHDHLLGIEHEPAVARVGNRVAPLRLVLADGTGGDWIPTGEAEQMPHGMTDEIPF